MTSEYARFIEKEANKGSKISWGNATSKDLASRRFFRSQGDSQLELSYSVADHAKESPILKNNCSIPKSVSKAVIRKLHEDLRNYLDFKVIWPILNGKLLLEADSQNFLMGEDKSQGDKVDFLVTELLKYQGEDLLKKFVECLHESRERGVGDAHQELIDEIHKLLKMEMEIYKETCKSGRLHKFCKFYSCIIALASILAILLVIFFLCLIIFSDFSVFQKKQSMVLRRNDNNLVTLDDVVRNEWVSAVTMSWNDSNLDCSGDIWIVPGFSCLDPDFLNLTLGEDPYSYTNPYYALPHSFVSITISGEDSATNYILRITKSIDSYVQFSDKYDDKRRSLEPCDEPLCYHTSKHINETILFNITEPDFYYVFLTDSNGELVDERYVSLRFYYNIFSFNLTAITEYATKHSIKRVHVDTDSSQTVKVSESFKFSRPTCNLLSYSCGYSDKYPAFIVEGAKARSDIIILIIVVGLCPIILACMLLCVRVHRQKKANGGFMKIK